MRATELIEALQCLIKQHGNRNVYVDCGIEHGGLKPIHELDVDADDTGIVLWFPDEDYGREDEDESFI